MTSSSTSPLRIALLVPCYNEEATVAQVIHDFRAVVPDMPIYVYDNNSRDRTKEIALANGAIVRSEPGQGKGNVVRRMFCDIEADVYVMVDGDATYEAAAMPRLVDLLVKENYAMVVGRRVHAETAAYRPGHVFGNQMFTTAVETLFGRTFKDILSGYRIMSRRFVKSFPVNSKGFEIETELTVHALTLRLPVTEADTVYGARPEGSASKLNTYRDGYRILRMIISLFRSEKPKQFYSLIGWLLFVLAIGLGIPLVITYFQTGLVPRIPTAVLITGLLIASLLSFVAGYILDTVTQGRREAKLLAYMNAPARAQSDGTLN
jgi:glycosyltransferase involved in cell wall biosynthesis